MLTTLAVSVLGTPIPRNSGLGQEGFEAVALLATDSVSAGETTAVWFGLKNTNDQARSVCLNGINYQVELGDHLSGFVGEHGPCGSNGDLHLLLPGETYFVATDVRIPEAARGHVGVFLTATGHHRPARPGKALGPEFKVAAWLEFDLPVSGSRSEP